MKPKLLILLFFVSSLLLVSCNKSDDDGGDAATLNGIWHLKNVSGGFVGVDVDYDRGEIVWNFNLTTGVLSVENNLEETDPDYAYSGLETGSPKSGGFSMPEWIFPSVVSSVYLVASVVEISSSPSFP